jgi:hypothetical protein
MMLRKSAVAAGAAMACALVVLWPAPTCAEEISDYERAGEWSEDGKMKFGEIAVEAELVADAKAPGGWALVRTISNLTDEPQTTTVEERIMRAESQLDARVDGTATVASSTMRTFKLGPHEKQKLGVVIPASIGQAISAGQRTRQIAERARDTVGETGMSRANQAAYDRTYAVFTVQYLKPLPPGATAEVVKNVTGPGRMPAAPMRGSESLDDGWGDPTPAVAMSRSPGTK